MHNCRVRSFIVNCHVIVLSISSPSGDESNKRDNDGCVMVDDLNQHGEYID